MISSTSFDLPEHRQQVIDACLRTGCFPLPMETLGATDANALQESLRLVNAADIYIGIFAFRYGFAPPGYEKSLTEMEYDRAVERDIPRLIFFMHEDHPLTAKDVEKGSGAEKLQKLKDRIGLARVAAFFKSKEDLRAHVVQALSQQRKGEERAIQIHYVSEIPEPPEPYVAHPYVLLESRELVGRRKELNHLTDWVAKPGSLPYGSRLFHVVAIGGQGKSALTWHWFQKIAEQEMKPLAGRMWWSFYESDATFENFVMRALAYVTRQTIEEVRKLPAYERETSLLAILDREPYLIVFDGMERLLLAYSGENVARLQDDTLDARTAHYVAAAYGLPTSATQSFTGQHRLRLTADPRVGSFLRKLTQMRASRVLISTRLFPADLQTSAQGEPVAACFAYFLPGLNDDDALGLWRAFGAKGSRGTMLPLLATFDKHPLLIQALASVVSHDRRAVGDFDIWRKHHPDFNPYPLLNDALRKSHVLSYALRGLDERQLRLLQTIAGFRMPTTYATLVALFVSAEKPVYASEPELDAALSELEDRGLLGWDRRANRYDLHPIVRGVVWSSLDASGRHKVVTTVHDHFNPIETPDWDKVESLDDLAPAIELFHTLITLERYEEAFSVFHTRLNDAMLWRLSANPIRVELVAQLFPDGFTNQRLNNVTNQFVALNCLAQAYHLSGRPGDAVPVYLLSYQIAKELGNRSHVAVVLGNLSYSHRHAGDIRSAEAAARAALIESRSESDRSLENVPLYMLGQAIAERAVAPGIIPERALVALDRSLRDAEARGWRQFSGVVNAVFAECALRQGDPSTAAWRASRAWDLAEDLKQEADFIRAARLQGTAALRAFTDTSTDYATPSYVHERLHHALARARACDLVEQELPTLTALAELHWVLASVETEKQPDHLKEARSLLDDVWDRAERGPFPVFHADALNILASIERTQGNMNAAKKAALAAYEKSWLQGPPFAYAFGLYNAKAHLDALGVPLPDLPPFDESLYEPMPDVQIDPDDPAT